MSETANAPPEKAPRDVEARISTAALRRNLETLKTLLPQGGAFSAIVKSDAYGHGATEVSRIALEAGARFLAVAAIEEARGLRNAGFSADILILGPISERQADEAVASNLTVCLGNLDTARVLHAAASRQNRNARVHLKFDTGMGRFGFRDDRDDLPSLIDAVRALDRLDIEGALTHYSEADNPESPYTAEQTKRFHRVLETLAQRDLRPRWVHAANSGALVHFPDTRFAMARIGIAMYGACPDARPDAPPPDNVRLEPVMSLVTRVADLRDLPARAPVSYGRRFTTARPSRLALLPMGYGNGYPRAATGNAHAIIRGRRVPLVGAITMNLIVADVTDLPETAIGDPALLFGTLAQEELRVEEVARAANTISYEILCNVGRGAPRRIVD